MPEQSTIDHRIAVTPGLLGGRPHLVGRHITVADVAVWHERMGLSADRICDEYGLTLGEVHAALAYYFDHKRGIDQRLAADEAVAAELRGKTPSLLQRKLKEANGG